jgi:hypothetical protein
MIGSFGSSSKVATVLIDPEDMTRRDRKNPMRPEDHQHVEDVISRHASLTREKYSNGREEHGGDCWQKPGMLAHAIDESSDLAVYLWTLRSQILDLAHKFDDGTIGLKAAAIELRRLVNK